MTSFKKMVLIPQSEYLQLVKRNQPENSISESPDNIRLKNSIKLHEQLNNMYQKQSEQKRDDNNHDDHNYHHNSSQDTLKASEDVQSSVLDESGVKEKSKERERSSLFESMDSTVQEDSSEIEGTPVKDNSSSVLDSGSSPNLTSSPVKKKVRQDSALGLGASPILAHKTPSKEDFEFLMKKISLHFDMKDYTRVNTIVARIVNTPGVSINKKKKKMALNDHNISFLELIDFLTLCVSRKKPQSEQKIQKFVDFFAKVGFPLHLITNPFIKKLVNAVNLQEISGAGASVSAGASAGASGSAGASVSEMNRSGSKAMTPKSKKEMSSTWFQSLSDAKNYFK